MIFTRLPHYNEQTLSGMIVHSSILSLSLINIVMFTLTLVSSMQQQTQFASHLTHCNQFGMCRVRKTRGKCMCACVLRVNTTCSRVY